MNDIIKKERLKKIRLILIILVTLILIPTGTYFIITNIKYDKKEEGNDEQVNNNIPTTPLDDSIDFENVDIKEVLSGTWYSCNDEFCYGFTYDENNNHTIFGLVLSDAIFDGNIKEVNKISKYRYELLIHHPKIECSDFGKITDDECKNLCSELLCNEEYRTYQIDISDLDQKKIYIKVVGIENYFDKFTLFDNSLGITIPYDKNNQVLDRFKNNMKILEE